MTNDTCPKCHHAVLHIFNGIVWWCPVIDCRECGSMYQTTKEQHTYN